MPKNCVRGKRCGNTCINQNYECRPRQAAAATADGPSIPVCRTGKHCGRACIPQNKKCRDEKEFLRVVGQSNAAQHWRGKKDQGDNHAQWPGYPAPRNTCLEAQSNLETDIITLEDKDNPSEADCKIAQYFCNPSTKGGYGGSRANLKTVYRKCGR